jgi:hypothetical protein
MITNKGKSILAKYLIGTAPAYASYIAIGCGAKPVATNEFAVQSYSVLNNVGSVTISSTEIFVQGEYIQIEGIQGISGTYQIISKNDTKLFFEIDIPNVVETPVSNATAKHSFRHYANKTSLDMEMFRIPIISRGYVNEDGVSKIVFTGELPTEERYEISEVGVYSAGSNPSSSQYDSRIIYSFGEDEGWVYHNQLGVSTIRSIYRPLDLVEANKILDEYPSNYFSDDLAIANSTAPVQVPVFLTNANNTIFTTVKRAKRYERSRALNNMIVMRGDTANLQLVDGKFVPTQDSNHIHLTGSSVNFSKNSPTDEFKLAFSILNKDGESVDYPDRVRVLVEFASSDDPTQSQSAKLEIDIENGKEIGKYDLSNNRYIVITKRIEDLVQSSSFTWESVNLAKIYVSTFKDQGGEEEISENFYVALDIMRLENNDTSNPLYGMSGYSVIKNSGAKTIIKESNTTNFVEFRFAMDVE